MTLDLAELRARLVTGWRRRMYVEIQVDVLRKLLDQLEAPQSRSEKEKP